MKKKLVTSFHIDCKPDGVDCEYTSLSTYYADGRIEEHTFGNNGAKHFDEVESFHATSPLNLDNIARAAVETGSTIVSFE